MLKKLFTLLLIPGLLLSAELTKKLTFPSPQVVKGKIYMPGCNTIREPFAPSLVQKGVCLMLPKGHKAVSYTVSHGEPVVLAGTHYVKPFKQGGRISFKPPADYYTRSSAIYDKNEFYPAEAKSEFFTTQYKNGIAMFVANVKPVQYNPVTGVIKYYPYMSVNVTTEAVGNAPIVKFTPLVKSLLSLQVDNPEALEGIPFTKPRADAYQYLIVTTDALKDAYNTFIEFNRRRGLKSQVQTMAWIKSNVSGTDDADKLRTYIKDQYDNNDIIFVLLGADDDNSNANDIPHRGMKAALYDYGTDYINDNDVAADLYFSCLDGTWKNSGSSYYGEFGSEDIGWEVYAARFPVDDATELNNMVNKTIKYSEQPVAGEVNNNLLAGEHLWGPPDHPVECWGGDCIEQYMGTCTKNNYTTIGFTADDWNSERLYDKNSSWTKQTFINTVNNDKIAWIDHVGHSNTSYIMKLYTSDVTTTNFKNTGTNANFFMATTWGCYPGSFDNRSPGGSYGSDCIAEKFTAGISNGAVAFLSNTRYGLGDDGKASADGTDGSNHRYQRWFHDAIFNKKIHYIEMMNAYSKEVNKDLICESDIQAAPYFGQMKYCGYELCIMGDPALSLWTATPQQLTADHPTTIAANATSFSWDTKKAYTTVALLDGARGEILCAQITGEDGKCDITGDALTTYLAANSGGKLGIHVKAHNFLPYAGEIQISGTGISNKIDIVLNRNFVIGKSNKITYSLSTQGMVAISIYDSKGALVKTLVNEFQSAGDHSILFSSKSLSNGIYYLKMTANNSNLVEKFVVTK